MCICRNSEYGWYCYHCRDETYDTINDCCCRRCCCCCCCCYRSRFRCYRRCPCCNRCCCRCRCYCFCRRRRRGGCCCCQLPSQAIFQQTSFQGLGFVELRTLNTHVATPSSNVLTQCLPGPEKEKTTTLAPPKTPGLYRWVFAVEKSTTYTTCTAAPASGNLKPI